MSEKRSVEDVLKAMHMLIAECPKIKGDPNRIVIDKRDLISGLEQIAECMTDMLDEYGLSKQRQEEAKFQMNRKREEIIERANTTAEDMYSASVLYTDEAITRLMHILDKSARDLDNLHHEVSTKIEFEKDRIRANQKELQETLFERRDANLYLNLINEKRYELAREKDEADKFKKGRTIVMPAIKKADIKINKAYFDQMGLNEDGTKKEEPKPIASAPEIKVNTNANYFKFKQQMEESKKNNNN